jgi:hypothetical protein
VHSQFVKHHNASIFRLLRKEFDYMMAKIKSLHKSKRFVSQLTTVIRALQFSMNLGVFSDNNLPISINPGTNVKTSDKQATNEQNSESLELRIPDNEAIALFISFYKLLFLGSKFAKKMLKLKVEKESNIVLDEVGTTTDEDGKSDSSYLIDTSDFIHSDFNPLEDPLMTDDEQDAY